MGAPGASLSERKPKRRSDSFFLASGHVLCIRCLEVGRRLVSVSENEIATWKWKSPSLCFLYFLLSAHMYQQPICCRSPPAASCLQCLLVRVCLTRLFFGGWGSCVFALYREAPRAPCVSRGESYINDERETSIKYYMAMRMMGEQLSKQLVTSYQQLAAS